MPLIKNKPSKSALKILCEQNTLSEIAVKLGVDRSTVSKWKRKYDLLGVIKNNGKSEKASKIEATYLVNILRRPC